MRADGKRICRLNSVRYHVPLEKKTRRGKVTEKRGKKFNKKNVVQFLVNFLDRQEEKSRLLNVNRINDQQLK